MCGEMDCFVMLSLTAKMQVRCNALAKCVAPDASMLGRVKSNENLTEGRSFTQKITLPGCPPPFFGFDDWAKTAVVGLWIAWAGTLFGAVHAIHSLAWIRLLPDRGPIERQVQ